MGSLENGKDEGRLQSRRYSEDRVAILGVGVLPDHSTLIYCPPPSKLENMAGSAQAPEAFPAASGAVHDPHAIPVSLIPEVRLTHS